MLENFDINPYKKIMPPANNSFDTMQEIKALTKIPISKDFIKKYDDITVFEEVLEREGLFDNEVLKISLQNFIKNLINTSRPAILELKSYFNRPRPKVMARNMNIKMDDVELESMLTPSYPSGHSAQGMLVGLALSKLFPKLKKPLMQVAKNISDSRNVARAHYKSDSDFGKKLGIDMYEQIKDKIS